MLFYLFWIPAVVIYYIIYAYLSKQFNEGFCNFWVFYLFNLLPIWVFVAKYSTNIAFDGLLYDVIMFLTFFITLVFLGVGESFTTSQWVGFCMVICGFLLMKLF
jgi:hypothetical protein